MLLILRAIPGQTMAEAPQEGLGTAVLSKATAMCPRMDLWL